MYVCDSRYIDRGLEGICKVSANGAGRYWCALRSIDDNAIKCTSVWPLRFESGGGRIQLPFPLDSHVRRCHHLKIRRSWLWPMAALRASLDCGCGLWVSGSACQPPAVRARECFLLLVFSPYSSSVLPTWTADDAQRQCRVELRCYHLIHKLSLSGSHFRQKAWSMCFGHAR